MPRPLRPDIENGCFHVMNRGIDHGTVFFDDAGRVEFGMRLADIYQHFGVIVLAYCLMNNHYHLLLRCPDGGLSDAMQRLSSIYTRHVNDQLGRDGALFRGRFHSRLIESDEHLIAACRYIHRNALDLPGVEVVDQYRWSSHRVYLGHRAIPGWMRTDEVLRYWNGDTSAFDRFVKDEGTASFAEAWTGAQISDLVSATAMVLSEVESSASSDVAARARSVVIAWASACPDVEHSDVAAALGISGSNGWRCAVSRARIKMRDEPSLTGVLDRAIALVAPESRLGSDPK